MEPEEVNVMPSFLGIQLTNGDVIPIVVRFLSKKKIVFAIPFHNARQAYSVSGEIDESMNFNSLKSTLLPFYIPFTDQEMDNIIDPQTKVPSAPLTKSTSGKVAPPIEKEPKEIIKRKNSKSNKVSSKQKSSVKPDKSSKLDSKSNEELFDVNPIQKVRSKLPSLAHIMEPTLAHNMPISLAEAMPPPLAPVKKEIKAFRKNPQQPKSVVNVNQSNFSNSEHSKLTNEALFTENSPINLYNEKEFMFRKSGIIYKTNIPLNQIVDFDENGEMEKNPVMVDEFTKEINKMEDEVGENERNFIMHIR